jgi:cobaltochelatase CobT
VPQSDNPLEAFRQALTGAARAISREPELELGLTADAPMASGKSIKVPMPGRTLPEKEVAEARSDTPSALGKSIKAPFVGRTLSARDVAEARGFADAAALKLRHHNAGLHQRNSPLDETARAVFNAAEQARVEALGARSMAGVRANLARMTEMRMRTDPITRARNSSEVPLSTALGLMIRERLTGEAPPEGARGGLKLVSDWIEEKAGADLDALGLALDDQAAFAALATKVLRDLELVEGELEPEPEPDQGEEGEGDREDEGDKGEDEQEQDAPGPEGQSDIRVETSDRGQDESDTDYAEEDGDNADDGMGQEGEEGIMPVRPNRPLSDLPPQFDYRVYTTRFDETVEASELCDEEELGGCARRSTSSSCTSRAR